MARNDDSIDPWDDRTRRAAAGERAQVARNEMSRQLVVGLILIGVGLGLVAFFAGNMLWQEHRRQVRLKEEQDRIRDRIETQSKDEAFAAEEQAILDANPRFKNMKLYVMGDGAFGYGGVVDSDADVQALKAMLVQDGVAPEKLHQMLVGVFESSGPGDNAANSNSTPPVNSQNPLTTPGMESEPKR